MKWALISLFVVATRSIADVTVIGKVVGSSHCVDELSQVWFTTPDNTLVYQFELPLGGSFELHSLPGEYSLVANTKSGCLIEKKLSLKEGKRITTELALREPDRKLNQKNQNRGKK